MVQSTRLKQKLSTLQLLFEDEQNVKDALGVWL